MLLLELFDKDKSQGGDGVVQKLRDEMLDVLVPLAAQGIPYVSIQAIMDKMNDAQSGLQIDRALVMHVLDPAECKMISKIEGDRVYFTMAAKDDNKAGEDEAQKNADKVGNMAMTQAKNNLKQQNGVPQAPAPSPEVAANPKTGPF